MTFGIRDRELSQSEQLRVSIVGRGDGVQIRFRTMGDHLVGVSVKLDRGGIVTVLPNSVRLLRSPLPENVVPLRKKRSF